MRTAPYDLLRNPLHILRCVYSCRYIIILALIVLILISYCWSSLTILLGALVLLMVTAKNVDDLVRFVLAYAEVPSYTTFDANVLVVH